MYHLNLQLGEKMLAIVNQCALTAEHATLLTLCYGTF